MKKVTCLLFLVLLSSCQSKVSEKAIKNLNGYWEIKEVALPDGQKKEYKINETIDYFEVKNNAGFRQKVMPQFDGSFKTNGIPEEIKIIATDTAFFIEYSSDYGKWKEQILSIEDSTLVLKNKDNLEYTYKKFKPFSLK